MKIEEVKLKHLEWVSGKEIDFKRIMTEAFGFTKKNPLKRFRFIKYFKQAAELGSAIALLDPKGLEYEAPCEIKVPDSIDHLSFMARLELESAIHTMSKRHAWEDISNIIGVACYGVNIEGDYSSENEQFGQLTEQILNLSLIKMLGLFNSILKWVEDSQKDWGRRFSEVSVVDPDFIQAGGVMLNRYNVITTIRNTCKDLNVSYDRAWQLSYAVIQTNELSKAATAQIQERMTKIKEARMTSQRNNQKQ